jgi:regulator of sirC expression with transglutaminase-like and TPR domain
MSRGCSDRSTWVSTLPPWRRLLAMLNWRPVYDIEQEELACEKQIKQIESEIEQLKQDNARLAILNSKMDALLRRDESSFQLPPSTGSN